MIDDIYLTWFFAMGTFAALSIAPFWIAHQLSKICLIKNTRFIQRFTGEIRCLTK